jgi:hypothetical protein
LSARFRYLKAKDESNFQKNHLTKIITEKAKIFFGLEIEIIKHIKRKQRIINENLSSKFENDRRHFQKQVIDIDV